MRAALISLTGGQLRLAGKTLARRQLDFALAAGCETVIVLGDGASAEAIALRHAAEGVGARFQAVRDSHGLLGAVRADDELLALAPGLLPEAAGALEALGKRPAVLVLAAGPGVAAGFERIDLERAWAGALVVGGAQVERLSDLPADIEPASALVRIALQARVPEKRLPEQVLADGSWSMPGDAAATERAWLERHGPASRSFAPTEWLGQQALRPLAGRLLTSQRSFEGLALAAVLVLAGAILAAWYGWSALGFALVTVGALLVDATAGLARLRNAPFGSARRTGLAAPLPWLVDATILACAVLAIEGSWFQRLFPPLVLLGTLHALRPATRSNWVVLPSDRGLLAALLAFTAGFGVIEPAIMLLALGLIALNVAQSRAERG